MKILLTIGEKLKQNHILGMLLKFTWLEHNKTKIGVAFKK